MSHGFNEDIFHPKRFIIMTLLFLFKALPEGDLVKAAGLDWGSFSTHIARLEKAGYVERKKTLYGGRVRVVVKITERGYKTYLEEVEKLRTWLDRLKAGSASQGGGLRPAEEGGGVA